MFVLVIDMGLLYNLLLTSIMLFFLFVELLNMSMFLISRIFIFYVFIEAFSYIFEDINSPYLKIVFSFVLGCLLSLPPLFHGY